MYPQICRPLHADIHANTELQMLPDPPGCKLNAATLQAANLHKQPIQTAMYACRHGLTETPIHTRSRTCKTGISNGNITRVPAMQKGFRLELKQEREFHFFWLQGSFGIPERSIQTAQREFP